MPYKFQKTPMPREADRRVHITDNDKEIIKACKASGMSIRAIARKMHPNVSRRSIQFILFPERYETLKEWRKKTGYMKKYHRAHYDRKKNTEMQLEHRRYKQSVLKNKI